MEQRRIAGWEALWLIVAPPAGSRLEDPPAGHVRWGEEVKQEARRLHAAGLTCEETAEALGVSFGACKGWLFPDGYLAAQERRKAAVREPRGRKEQVA